MSKVVEKVYPIVEKFAKECNVEVMDIEYAKKNNGYNLTIYISKDGGINIEDCVKLHKLIDGPLDEADPTNGENYILNVSSWSVGKVLRTYKEFDKAIGRKVEVKLYESVDGSKSFDGVLRNYSSEGIKVQLADGKEYEFTKSQVASIILVFEDEGEENAK